MVDLGPAPDGRAAPRRTMHSCGGRRTCCAACRLRPDEAPARRAWASGRRRWRARSVLEARPHRQRQHQHQHQRPRPRPHQSLPRWCARLGRPFRTRAMTSSSLLRPASAPVSMETAAHPTTAEGLPGGRWDGSRPSPTCRPWEPRTPAGPSGRERRTTAWEYAWRLPWGAKREGPVNSGVVRMLELGPGPLAER